MPNCAMGGVSRGRLTLAHFLDPAAIQFTGMTIVDGRNFDPGMALQLARHMPLYADVKRREHFGDCPAISYESTLEAAILRAALHADVLVVWAVGKLAPLLTRLRLSCKVLLMSHGGAGSDWTRRENRPLEPLATHFGAVSHGGTQVFSEELRPLVHVLYNGADANRCAPTIPREEMRRRWGFSERHRLVGFVGRYSREKNPLAIARTVASLGGDFRAVYVGSGVEERETRAEALRIAGDRVVFLPRTDDVGNVLAALDVFVLASPSEGGPQAVVEAWLAECPVVATPVGIIPEYEQRFGPLTSSIPHGASPRQIGAAVVRALKSSHQAVVRRARQVAWRELTAPAMASRWNHLLLKMANRPSVAKLRVGFLKPYLAMGGVGWWIAGLAKHFDPEAISLTGLGLKSSQNIDMAVARQIVQYMPIAVPGQDHPSLPRVDRLSRWDSWPAVVSHITANSDVVIVWGECDLAGKDPRCKIVLVSHGGPYSESTVRMVRKMLPSATDYAACSRIAVDTYPPEIRPQVRIIHTGADASRCRITQPREQLRASWGFTSRQRLIGHIGRFHKEKNPLAPAQAVAKLKGSYRAVYIGSGMHEDWLRAEASRMAGHRVTFLPPCQNVGDAINALDVFVMTSPSEGFCQALAEAWLVGVPVVATNTGAVKELECRHGPLVVPVPIDPTPQQLAAAVRAALRRGNRTTVERAQDLARRELTAERTTAQWVDFLHEVTGR